MLLEPIHGVVVSDGYSDYLDVTLSHNRPILNHCVVVTSPSDTATQQVACKHDCELVITAEGHEAAAESFNVDPINGPAQPKFFNKGLMIEKGLIQLPQIGWRCIAGQHDVKAAHIKAASRRFYRGSLIELTTRSGRSVTVTPDHKLLTQRGWISSKAINKSDHLFHIDVTDTVRTPQVDQHPSVFGKIIDSLLICRPFTKMRAARMSVNFESKLTDGDVDVVWADSLLRRRLELSQCSKQALFELSDKSLAALVGNGNLHFVLKRFPFAQLSLNAGFCPSSYVLRAFSGGTHDASATLVPDRYTTQPQLSGNGSVVNTEDSSQRFLALSSEITPDDIVSIQVIPWCNHVYDLATASGWYTANGLIIHNCQFDADIVFPGNMRQRLGPALHDKSCLYSTDRMNVVGWAAWQRLIQSGWTARGFEYQHYLTYSIDNAAIGSRLIYGDHGWVPIGFLQIWHSSTEFNGTSRIRSYPTGSNNAAHDDVQFGLRWDRAKRVLIPEILVAHLLTDDAKYGVNWNGRKTKKFGPEAVEAKPKKEAGK
jgi:hypothetical protein